MIELPPGRYILAGLMIAVAVTCYVLAYFKVRSRRDRGR